MCPRNGFKIVQWGYGLDIWALQNGAEFRSCVEAVAPPGSDLKLLILLQKINSWGACVGLVRYLHSNNVFGAP